jgi:thiamine-phosphate pyrophosphorylase
MTASAKHSTKLRGLYAVADSKILGEAAFSAKVAAALRGGARLIQYRDKSDDYARRFEQASRLLTLCRQHQALLIINDDYKLCAEIGADGVHLGMGDAGLRFVRDTLGPDAIIGATCHNAIALAENAANRSADYVAFGAFYPSPVKPDAVRAFLWHLTRAKERTGLPVCAIGGITEHNAAPLAEHGADMLAVISGLFAQPDLNAIENAARRISSLYESH